MDNWQWELFMKVEKNNIEIDVSNNIIVVRLKNCLCLKTSAIKGSKPPLLAPPLRFGARGWRGGWG